MDMLEVTRTPSNAPEFTGSELSGAIKTVIEGETGLGRVRGEVGRAALFHRYGG
jgi:exodeoxyribonuclease VII large subunit